MAKKISEEDRQDYEELFKLFDHTDDGSIDVKEIAHVFKIAGFKLTEDEIQTLMKECDKTGDGLIDKEEFIRAVEMYHREDEMEHELVEAFLCFDKNGDGHISEDELNKAFSGIGFKGYNQEKLMACADLDGDRRVSYEEFLKIMRLKRL